MLSGDRLRLLRSMVLAALSALPGVSSAADAWQVEQVRVDGVSMAVRSGVLEAARPAIAAALAARWEASGSAVPMVTVSRARTVIGRQRGALHETVSLTDVGAGRSRVLVTVRDLRIPISPPPRLPDGLPTDLRSLRVVEQLDGQGGSGTDVFILDHRRPPAQSLGHWHRTMAASGWKVRVIPPDASVPQHAVLLAERGRERVSAVFDAGPQGTRVVLQASPDGR